MEYVLMVLLIGGVIWWYERVKALVMGPWRQSRVQVPSRVDLLRTPPRDAELHDPMGEPMKGPGQA